MGVTTYARILEAVRAHISEPIGRRMEDRELCSVVQNEAPQWTGGRAA